MRWSCGLTTVPERFALLQRTAVSLAKAGFDDLLIGVDGCGDPERYDCFPRTSCRRQRNDNFANWYLTACEAYLSDPFADAYAMFEDDLVCCLGLREYVERAICDYPRGYLNLYTDVQSLNHAGLANNGWFETKTIDSAGHQQGRGAVALAFSRDAFVKLLRSPHTIFHANDTTITRGDKIRGRWFVDALVVTVLNGEGYREMCHYPALTLHTGDQSTLGNAGYRQAPFYGETFDIMRSMRNR